MNAQLECLLSRLENVVAGTLVLGKVYTLTDGKKGIYMYRYINKPDKYTFGLKDARTINSFFESSFDFDPSKVWVNCSIDKVQGEDADQTLQQDPNDSDFKACVEFFKEADRPPK